MKLSTTSKAICIAFVVLLMTSIVSAPVQTGSDLAVPGVPDKGWDIDGTYMRDWTQQAEQARAIQEQKVSEFGILADPETDMEILVSDFGLNVDYEQNFHYVLTGEHCYMYVALDLEFPFYNYYDDVTGEYVFENPISGGGWSAEDRISVAQLQYFADEFDSNIYPTLTSTFGLPEDRPEGEARIYILVMNIRDESYYDSAVTSYIVGYFSWGEQAAYNKNMIHIDTYDWVNRTGPGVARPYLMEGVVAHEFEHLIHQDIDSGEDSWIDEGCADLAIMLCGYGHSQSHIYSYLTYYLITPLTYFGGGLESYGASYLFALYLWEHFGGTPFIVDLVYNPLHSIEGVVDTLHDNGYMISFDEVFRRWAIANYIDDTSIDGGIYGYYTLDIPSKDTWGISIEYRVYNNWVGPPFSHGFYMDSWEWYGPQQPYTAQYWDFEFNPSQGPVSFEVGGDAYSGIEPYGGDYHYYTGLGNWLWRRLYQTFVTLPANAHLKFYTYYEIEEDWDYGYVEVHDLTTDEWTTLPGLHTTTTLPHIQDNPNAPEGREPLDYFADGKWNAFTGYSLGYYQEDIDLSAYEGHDIELYFVYWTDGAANLQGWYLDNIEITETPFFDDVESGWDGWTHDEGWVRTNPFDFPNDWMGEVFSVTGINGYRKPSFRYKMRDGPGMVNFTPGKLHHVWTPIDDSLTIPNTELDSGQMYVAVFWNSAPHILPGSYYFGVT